MRIVVAQLNPIVGDLAGNCKKILRALDEARQMGADGVVFPELSLCGYPPEDLLLHESFIAAQQTYLEKVVQASQGLFVIVGLARCHQKGAGKPLFNSVAIIEDRKVLGFVDKQLLPTYDVFDERRYFEPGDPISVWQIKGKKVGVLICEDIWQHASVLEEVAYHTDPVLQLKEHNPDLVINVSASPYQQYKLEKRISVVAKAAETLKCPVVYCCQVGANDQLVFDGYSFCLDEKGELRKLAKGFEEDLMQVDLSALPAVTKLQYDPMENLYKALVLGIRDYLHKLGLKKGCIGISGGVDSALVAALAVEALGKENVMGAFMPSCYTAKESSEDAYLLAKALEIELKEIPIKKPFEVFLELLTPHFEGKPVDVTEENIQARIRGTILMALSNKFGSIVLSTGNKSEVGLGYCTLYGDMCGGLSVISDLTKHQVYELCHWINSKRPVIPERTLERAPSAELRPDQKDSDSLPPYDLVDRVVKGFVEGHKSAQEIAREEQIDLAIVKDLIGKIFFAEYKRRQGAPGIRVTKKSFRAGRRYPIVQKWREES